MQKRTKLITGIAFVAGLTTLLKNQQGFKAGYHKYQKFSVNCRKVHNQIGQFKNATRQFSVAKANFTTALHKFKFVAVPQWKQIKKVSRQLGNNR